MLTLSITAVQYARRGIHVFPVQPGGKTPLTGRGVKEATTNTDTIQEWWQRWPDANIGAAMGQPSGSLALDFDCKSGKPGLKTFESLCIRFNLDTLTASTPSGGVHLFFKYPGDMLKNNVERLPGVDIRTTGGYVLLAPSVVNGKPYRWTRIVAPTEMPAGLIALLQKPTPAPARIILTSRVWPSNRLSLIERARRYVDATPGAVQGEGGDVATFKLACRLVRGFDLNDDEALMVLSSWNQRCRPAWSEQELLSKISSARRNGLEPIGGKLEVAR